MDKAQELLHDIKRAVRFSQEVYVPVEQLVLDPVSHEFGVRTYAAVEAEIEDRVKKFIRLLLSGSCPQEKRQKVELKLGFEKKCLVCCRNSKAEKQKQIIDCKVRCGPAGGINRKDCAET